MPEDTPAGNASQSRKVFSFSKADANASASDSESSSSGSSSSNSNDSNAQSSKNDDVPVVEDPKLKESASPPQLVSNGTTKPPMRPPAPVAVKAKVPVSRQEASPPSPSPAKLAVTPARKSAAASLPPGEETLLHRCKRLKRNDLTHKRNEEAAQEAERIATEAGLNDPLKGYKPKRPPRTPFPTDLPRLEARQAQLRQQVTKLESEMRMKDSTKTVSLGTSKVNYIDPRIISAWCQRTQVPIEKVFAKTLINKFPWALGVDPAFRFQRSLDPTGGQDGGRDDSESGEESD